jgi:hypothetical protein
MSFQIKPVETFPYQIQPGLETWRLIDLRSGETVDELPRTAMGGICNSFNYGQLKGKAFELAATA